MMVAELGTGFTGMILPYDGRISFLLQSALYLMTVR